MPALINMMTGMDASALEPAIMYIVNSTKFGSKLANPGQSIGVIFGTPIPNTDRIYKMHQNQSDYILIGPIIDIINSAILKFTDYSYLKRNTTD